MAGGEGTRLRPLTEGRPKPLIPILEKPCIYYVIKSMVSAGFRDIFITTGYLSHQLIKMVGDGQKLGARILYSFESVPLGTAGSVKRIADMMDGTFIVGSGDVLADVDIDRIYEFHRRKGAEATMALTEVENPTEFGIVGLNEEDKIVKFKEKPKDNEIFSNLINAGIYVLEPEVMEYVPEYTMFDFSKNLFPKLLEEKRRLYGAKITGMWIDIGRPHDMIRANLAMLEKMGSMDDKLKVKCIIGENVDLDEIKATGRFYVGNNCKIKSGSELSDAVINRNCNVGRECMIEDAVLLEGTTIEDKSIIFNSVIGENVYVQEGAKIKNSILGDNVVVRKGTKIDYEKVMMGDVVS